MTHVAPTPSFTTGNMDMEEHSFTWTIENFPVIRKSKSMIDAQKIHFSAGTEVGHPSKWIVFLRECTVDGKKWIGIYFNVEVPSATDSTWKNVFAEMLFVKEVAVPIIRDTGSLEIAAAGGGFGIDQFISADSTQERLVIKNSFKLYVPLRPTEVCQATLKKIKFGNQTKGDSNLLLNNSIPGCDFKLISTDKKGSISSSNVKRVMPPSSFATGMMAVEEQSLTWTIENFPVISKQKFLIDQQMICFSAGTSVGHPSKWSLFLQEFTVDGKKWIAILLNLVEPPASDPSWKNVLAEMTFAKEGAFPVSRETGQMQVPTFPRTGLGRYIVAGGSTEEKLVIKNTFRLFVPSKPTESCLPLGKEVKELQVQFANQAKKNWDLLRKNTIPGNEIKVILKDKKEFSVRKEFLAGTAPYHMTDLLCLQIAQDKES